MTLSILSFCPCIQYTEIASGGITASGSATLTDNIIEMGGITVSGSATVDIGNDVYDGFGGCWSLQELDSTFLDASRNANHLSKTGDDTTAQVSIGWLNSQQFASQTRLVATNPLDNSEHSISFWVQLEGYRTTHGIASTPYIKINHSKLSHIVCSTSSGNFYSSTKLQRDRMYHICISYDLENLKIYIDGELDVTHAVSSLTASYTPTVGGSDGRSFFTGELLDVRLYDHTVASSVPQCEYSNLCGNMVEYA